MNILTRYIAISMVCSVATIGVARSAKADTGQINTQFAGIVTDINWYGGHYNFGTAQVYRYYLGHPPYHRYLPRIHRPNYHRMRRGDHYRYYQYHHRYRRYNNRRKQHYNHNRRYHYMY